METLKKTLFLTNKNDKNNKTLSTLTLERKNSSIFCTMKCYNSIPKGNLILGLQVKDKIIKQNISFDNNPYNFILSQNIDLNEKISCVLIDNVKNDFTPIIWGSESSCNFKSHILGKLKESIDKLTTAKIDTRPIKIEPDNIQEKPEEKIKTYSPHEINISDIEDVHNNISQISMLEEKINCDIAVAQANLFEYDESEIQKTIDKELDKEIKTSDHKFYNMIAEQIEELFEKYPREYNLEKLIENSQWVKITYDDDIKSYVVGIIYNNDDIKYICYGVPGNYNTTPSGELVGYSQWLPTDISDPYNNGYWVMYQDADSGENILIE